MKVKILASQIKDYEELANKWLAENEGLDVKGVGLAISAVNPYEPFLTSVIFYKEKASRLDE